MCVLLDLYSHKDRHTRKIAELVDVSFRENHTVRTFSSSLAYLKQAYQGHANVLKETIVDTFSKVLQVNVKKQLKPIPSDGNVHPVTSFLMAYLGFVLVSFLHDLLDNLIEFKQLINENNLIVIHHKPMPLKSYILLCIDDLKENILSTRKVCNLFLEVLSYS